MRDFVRLPIAILALFAVPLCGAVIDRGHEVATRIRVMRALTGGTEERN